MKKRSHLRFNDPEIERFESLAAFREAFRACGARVRGAGKGWTGETQAEAEASFEHGDTANVAEAESVLAEIDAGIDRRGLAPRWGRDVVGAFPDVPAYLAGAPENMIRRSPQASRGTDTPLDVYFASTCNAGTTLEQARRRGCAVLALSMALSNSRPVRIFWYSVTGHRDVCIQLTNPIVLSEAAWVLGSPSFFRNVTFQFAWRHGWDFDGKRAAWSCTGPFSREHTEGWTVEQKTEHVRKCLGASEDALVLLAADDYHGGAGNQLADPVAWVNGVLDAYREA